jgi:energy-coupling factor transport system permease protein
MVAISGVITVIIWPGPAAFHVGPLRISRPGIDLAIRATTQFFVILYTSALMTMTTAPSALGHALIWYLSPLRRLRVPVDDIGVMVSLALALLPPLLVGNLRRAEELAVAMEARGYISGTSRTILKAGHLGRNDVVAIAATLLCAAVAIWL